MLGFKIQLRRPVRRREANHALGLRTWQGSDRSRSPIPLLLKGTTMHIVPDYAPLGTAKAEAIASRLRAFAFTLKIWEEKKAHAQAMIDEYTRAREAFIGHLPSL